MRTHYFICCNNTNKNATITDGEFSSMSRKNHTTITQADYKTYYRKVMNEGIRKRYCKYNIIMTYARSKEYGCHEEYAWWRHQMETFSALLAFCAGNFPVTGEFLEQRPLTRNFDVFFDLHLNQQLSKQWRRRWFETPSRSLWRNCNGCMWNEV